MPPSAHSTPSAKSAAASLSLPHLSMHSAADVHELFRRLGYEVADPEPFEGDEMAQFEFDPVDVDSVRRVYIIGQRDTYTVYLIEVGDLHLARLRGLAWNVLQRGSALLVVTKDYREVVFVDPRFSSKALKSNVRVNKLKVLTADPTRHDLDTLNAIHAYHRTGMQIYDAQAEAFNVNTVTRRFYDEYRVNYERVRTAAQRYNLGVRDFQDADKTDKLHAFAQRLLGRLMFIYFLQRKGWLGGRARFLTEQYQATIRDHAGENDGETFFFYTEVLTPLFFDTFNKQRLDNVSQWSSVLIPYLNGGLFDPVRDPDGPILLPDSLFDSNSNEGILAFFNRYNFTVSEDTPLEQDVAVDPEMLGKVFENLLEERDRGQSGSFYTPRVIVAYMCQEALAGYLEESAAIPRDLTRAQWNPDSSECFSAEQAAAVNRALDTLTVLDPAVGSGSFLIGMMTEIIRLRRACSTAIGQDITPALLADWKEAIIRDTLYGVDIKPEAIEVAQLRLWLALVVEQSLDQARPLPNLDYKLMPGNSLIETIDGELVLGLTAGAMLDGDGAAGNDSDSGVAVLPMQTNLFGNAVQPRMDLFSAEQNITHERLKLDSLRKAFFRATPTERQQLRGQIMSQERQIVYASLHEKSDRVMAQVAALGKKAGLPGGLTKAEKTRLDKLSAQLARLTALESDLANPAKPLPFFLYRMHFHEVFAAKGGFDVVIANPPYVRGDLITAQKPELKAAYPHVYAGTADLYTYFFARAFDVLRSSGQLAFITTNKYLRAKFGGNLRMFLSSEMILNTIIDFGDLPIFDVAAYPCIVTAKKGKYIDNHLVTLSVNTMEALDSLPESVLKNGRKIVQTTLGIGEWQIGNSLTADILEKLTRNNVPLQQFVANKLYYGVKTGFNKAFEIDATTRERLIAEDASSSELIKPWLRGRDVKRWLIDSPNLYVIFSRQGINIEDYPAILNYLSQFKERLMPGAPGGRKQGTYKWYELQDTVAYFAEFEKPKIIYPHFNTRANFTLDKTGYFSNNKTYVIGSSDTSLLGILNSNVVHFFLSQITTGVRGGYLEYTTQTVSRIPIPNAPEALREQIAAIAKQCLATPDAAKRVPLETRLNALVYQAYGLTDAEIQVVEVAVGGQANVPDTIEIENEVSE